MKMNISLGSLNKKVILQLVVLVLVAVVGVGVYLRMQTGGGLPFLDQFLGKEAPKPAPAPAPAPVAPPPKPPEPEFPAHPPKGQLLGKAFASERAYLEEGVLVLRQGQGEVADIELRLHLPGIRWETPAGKTFKLENAAGPDVPRVHVGLKEEGKTGLTPHEFAEKYSLKLELGPEKDRKLTGRIKLVLPDEAKSALAGTFEAEIRGFRIIDGKPDLAADSVDTLEYLALREILKDDPDKAVQDVDLRDGHYVIPGDATKPKTGYLEAAYQLGEGAPTVQRFQFVKEAEGWRVLRVLAANQLAEAHPHEAPNAESKPEQQMIYQAAARLEKDLAKKQPKKGIYGAMFDARANDKTRLGLCEISYRPALDAEPVKTSYLFRLKQGAWTLDRVLAKTEVVDLDKGVIRKQAARVPAKSKAKTKATTKR